MLPIGYLTLNSFDVRTEAAVAGGGNNVTKVAQLHSSSSGSLATRRSVAAMKERIDSGGDVLTL
jgi:hypothetical protein